MRQPAACFALALLFALLAAGHADANPPGYGYATDNANRIVSVNLANGTTTVYSGQTAFGANALGYSDTNGVDGSVIYANSSGNGELASWNRATNTHTDIGNIVTPATGKTYTNAFPTGTSISDAAYWNGSTGPLAGYYVVTSAHAIYRVDFATDGTAASNITGIQNVTLVMTIPSTVLTSNFSFGDIAFSPLDGTLYLSDSGNGFSSFNLTTKVATKLGSRYDGQIAFGQDGKLYGVGSSSGTPSTQGNDFYQISLTDGSLIGAPVTNTDPGQTYTDFSGAAALDIVPEPGTLALLALGGMLGAGAAWRRRKA